MIDFWLSSGTALILLKEVKQRYPQVRILVVSGDENNDIWQKVHTAGGHGFVLKTSHLNYSPGGFALNNNQDWFPEGNESAIKSSHDHLNKFNLTPRQIDVLTMMLRGLPNKRIATQLSISEPTVKEHISNILKRSASTAG